MKIVLLGLEENIYFREVLKRFSERNLPLEAIIIEKNTPRGEAMLDYLKNDFYNPPSVAELLKGKTIPVHAVSNLNGEDTEGLLKKYAPDVVMLGGSSRILKPHIINAATIGIINCHPGLLPEYKGIDVVGWAIYHGAPIGATCHFIDTGVDSGPILLRKEADQPHRETLLEVRVRVMRLAAKLMVESVEGIMKKTITAKPQTASGTTYGSIPFEIVEEVEKKLLSL
jgi:methionyl-tRNA formyltransferase